MSEGEGRICRLGLCGLHSRMERLVQELLLGANLAVTLLTPCTPGCLVVRNSQSQAGNNGLALTLRIDKSFNSNGILHYLIAVSESGFRIKGFTMVFSSFSGLLVQHSVIMWP